MERTILHLDLNTFFVSVERLREPKLIGRPVLIGSDSDRGVVASCSYEARAFGVRSAMPMKMAKQLCPEAIILRGDSGAYLRKSDEVTELIRETVPMFEKSSVDEFYVDLSGTDKFHGSRKLAVELRQKIIKESGLPNCFGLSINKTVSKVATGEAKNGAGEWYVERGTEKPFLAPMPIERIPGVGGKTAHLLRSMGVAKILTLQELQMDLLQRLLGQHGPVLWRKANGIDDSPVIAWHERKSISTERTFSRDTIDVVKLKGLLTAMAESLTFQLRKGSKLTSCVAVKIRYADMNTHTKQLRIGYTACDHIILPAIHELFRTLYDRRQRIRLVGVRFSHLVGGGHQMDAFTDTQEAMDLYQAMDKVRKRFGDRVVMRASGMDAKSIGRMDNPFDGQAPVLLANRRT
ncbi:MAG: DNA polymerase IV [Flavobacteriales bacterium]|jgi:DNA polymerase-4|nr:DNA polymerase IV [Flavobacteriales bacterium]MBK6882520.1 DNA polymerase IV [Flavobacteriales bacterium]MBK7111972.1 DNA polymerase IV [Flavobacteriales bacterium]MBK7482028.1 DNA polymerase IV [Flavobacteriales bacterium]MBK7619000.1 DNA polymerase IV [Flavobacteriales bacterium]